MNIFRLIGDILHVLSFFFLSYGIKKNSSVRGISLVSLELFLAVFCTRYVDLFWNFTSLYNSVMKILFIGVTGYIVFQIRRTRLWHSYDKKQDSKFRYLYLVIPCLVLAILFHDNWTSMGWGDLVFEIMWAFSIYLEAVAIMPQLFLLQNTGEVENMQSWYIFCMGGYRGFYLINWIYRWFTEAHYSAWKVWIAGIIQTALYADFFYYFVKGLRQGSATLPGIKRNS